MAQVCRSGEVSYVAGVQVADGRSGDRSAKSHKTGETRSFLLKLKRLKVPYLLAFFTFLWYNKTIKIVGRKAVYGFE